jgi:hypothetical protein
MILIYRQQTPPSLPFARPWAKINSVMDQDLLQMLSRFKSTHAFIQELSFGLQRTILTLNLPILPFTMGLVAVTWVFSSQKTEWSSQALCLKLFDQPLFQSFAGFSNKTQRFLCMTLLRLSFMVFLNPHQGIYGVCLLSSLKIYGIFGIRNSNIIPSLSPYF